MKQQTLYDMIAPAVAAVGFDLYGVEYLPQGKYSLLRVYIDGANGVNLDDCARASRQISAILDVEDPISGNYNLEVSSPGIDRPLFTPEQYSQAIGQIVKVVMLTPIEGQRKFTGEILSVAEDNITLIIDQHEQLLALHDVVKAHVVDEL